MADGAGGVHTHMTNSRLTDPEVLEFRFPVRVDSYEIRLGSGGEGRWAGGDGGVRRIRFLEPMTAIIVSSRRNVAPFGLAGGSDGEIGENWVRRRDGRWIVPPGVPAASVPPSSSVPWPGCCPPSAPPACHLRRLSGACDQGWPVTCGGSPGLLPPGARRG